MRMRKRPGFMVFHDDLQFVGVMCDEDAGRLFKAMLAYSASDIEPQFSGDMLRMGWAIVRPMIERDKQRYQAVCDNNSYSAYCKNADARGEVRMSKEEYLSKREAERCDGVRAHSNGTEGMRFVPTTTPTTIPTATAASTAAGCAVRDLNAFRPYDAAVFEQKRRERLNMLPVC